MFAGGLVAGSTAGVAPGGATSGAWQLSVRPMAGYRDRRLTGIVAATHHQVGGRTDNSERSKGQNSNRQYIAFLRGRRAAAGFDSGIAGRLLARTHAVQTGVANWAGAGFGRRRAAN